MAAFATAAELQTFIGGTGLDTTRADALLGHASAVIRRFTGQTLSEELGDVATFWPTDSVNLILPQRPVTDISSITEGPGADPVTDFLFSRVGVIRRSFEFPLPWDKGTVVTYDHGYAAGSDEIAAIKTVCLQVAARTLQDAGAQIEQFGPGTEAVGFSPDAILTAEEKRLLADFGHVLVG
jgi:hypothetical protein